MLNKIAWLAGYTGRKTADYLTGTDTTRGKIEEIKLSYKAGTHRIKASTPSKPKTKDNNIPSDVQSWAEDNNWVFPTS